MEYEIWFRLQNASFLLRSINVFVVRYWGYFLREISRKVLHSFGVVCGNEYIFDNGKAVSNRTNNRHSWISCFR